MEKLYTKPWVKSLLIFTSELSVFNYFILRYNLGYHVLMALAYIYIVYSSSSVNIYNSYASVIPYLLISNKLIMILICGLVYSYISTLSGILFVIMCGVSLFSVYPLIVSSYIKQMTESSVMDSMINNTELSNELPKLFSNLMGNITKEVSFNSDKRKVRKKLRNKPKPDDEIEDEFSEDITEKDT